MKRRIGSVLAGAAGVLAIVLLLLVRGAREVPDVLTEEALEVAGEPATVFTPERLAEVTEPVQAEVERGAFPGAALAVGVRGHESHLAAFGHIGWTRNAPPVDPRETIYDLASLTKVLATAAAVMLLVEEGRMSLDDPVSRHVPAFTGGLKDRVTIRHLLSHTSGLAAGARPRGRTRTENIQRVVTLMSVSIPPGTQYEYSDVGYIVLYEAAERAAGEPLPRYLERKLFRPLGMTRTGFAPGLECEACAPTGRLRDQRLYRGRPFDPIAQTLDGVSGQAGLFGTAHDVGRFAAMLMNGGELDGVRVLSEHSVDEFLRHQEFAGGVMLGWEILCRTPPAPRAPCAEPIALGHTGWTGTSLWMDPQSGIWTVLLTNRTYEPRAPNRLQEVRREVYLRATGRD